MPDEKRAIEPALSAEEWQEKRVEIGDVATIDFGMVDHLVIEVHDWPDGSSLSASTKDPDFIVAAVAAANAALPDDDPRKITYRDVDLLRETANSLVSGGPNLWALANKLESLLPPDVTTYTLLPPE
jgi:hypothetical protein